jgi:hypothetical protein
MIKMILGGALLFFIYPNLMTSNSFIGFMISFFIFLMGFNMLVSGFDDMKSTRERTNRKPNFVYETRYNTFTGQNYFSSRLKEFQEGLDEQDLIGTYLAAMSVHIAKSDGHISENEMNFLRKSLEKFPGRVNHSVIAETVKITKEYLVTIDKNQYLPSLIKLIEEYLTLFNSINPIENREIYFDLMTLLYGIGLADTGFLNYESEFFFQRLFQILGFSPGVQEYIKVSAHQSYAKVSGKSNYRSSTQKYNPPKDKIKEGIQFFGLSDQFTKEELEVAWKKMAKTYHPDKYHNADEKVYKEMNQKFVEAKEYYQILQERFKS